MNESQEARVALEYAAAGMSVVPVKLGGSKEPKGKWKDLQSRILNESEIRRAFREQCGVGVINGKVSGNKEVIDIDNPELVAPFEKAVQSLAPGLLERLPTVATPRNNYGGRHYHLRIEGEVAGNTKLAESEPRLKFNSDGTPDLDPKTGKQKIAPDTWIETRGEGGFTIMPGSHPQCHASGLPYKHVAGPPPTEVPVISAEEHSLLWRVAQSFNRNVPQHVVRGDNLPATIGQAPGQAFAAATSWDDILVPAGWQRAYEMDGIVHWRRPGKSVGTSATTGVMSQAGNELFCVFSSNAYPFEGAANGRPCTSYSKFAAHTVLNHSGDFGAAARELAAKGFGDPPASNGKVAVKAPKKIILPDAYEPFPVRALPTVCADFVRDAARSIDCDEGMVALPLIVTIAAAIGNTYRVQLKRDYSEPAIIWGAVVCESGTRKSPALEAPIKRLRQREAEELRRFQLDLEAYGRDLKDFKAIIAKALKSKTGGGPSPLEPNRPVSKRYIVNDITVEALAVRMEQNPRGLMLCKDELAGFFSSFNQYKSGRGSDESCYLAMHGGRSLVVDRKQIDKPSIVVPMASLSVIGSIQPGILKRAFSRERMESGMAARFLLTQPPVRIVQWNETPIDQLTEDRLGTMLDQLLEVQIVINEATCSPEPMMLPLTPEAKRRWIDFHDEHSAEQAELHGDLSAAWSKLTGYAARLGLICELADWAVSDCWDMPPVCVSECAMKAGIAMARWFSNETRRIYDCFDETDDDTDLRNLIDYIRRQGGFVASRDLTRGPRRYRKAPELAEADLERLVQGEAGRWINQPPGRDGGRPTRVFCLKGFDPGDETGLETR